MNPSRILVVHTGGGIGDVLLATPVAWELRRAWPRARLDFLARQGTAAVLEGNPHIDEILRLPHTSPRGPAEIARQAAWLRRRAYDLALVLWSRSGLAWMLYLAGIPRRVGQASRLMYSFLYTDRVVVRSERGDVDTHWSEILLDYVRVLGVRPEPPRPLFVIPPEAQERADRLLAGLDGSGPLVGFHSTKGLRVDAGRWPVDAFAAWARALHQRLGARLVLTGTPEEKDLVAEVEARSGVPALNLAGRTDLATLAALARRCQVFVCPDSGPMHLAAAVGTPTVGIYALAEDFPRRWAPLGAPARVVRPQVIPCRPGCRKATCPDFRCYRAVEVAAVVEAVADLLALGQPRT